MADRPGKIAKLQSFRSRLPFVSQSALAQILQIAAKEDLPGSCTRKDVRRARDDKVTSLTPYGPLHQIITMKAKDGTDLKVEVQHPCAMLWRLCAESKSFSDLLSRAMTSKPCSLDAPWSLVLYADEILPGNQLAYKNARKMWGIYWTILNLGSAALSDEEQHAEMAIFMFAYITTLESVA